MAASTSASGAADTQDRLSALPDCILLLILSFVPTLDAVHTSILSRRWRYLWTTIGTLDLDEAGCAAFFTTGKRKRGAYVERKRKEKFVEFVYQVFHHMPALHKFRLSCTCALEYPVEDWVHIAVTRDVGELDLRLRTPSLPPRLFLSRSLVHLKLDLGYSKLKLPASLGLTGLRSLHLSRVSLCDDRLTRELFSSCACLRSLALLNCGYQKLSCLEISNPSLRSLTVDGSLTDDGLKGISVKISATQLTSFIYRANLAQAYDVERIFFFLVDVEVEFLGFMHGIGMDRRPLLARVHRFLHHLSFAKNLRICRVCVEALSKISSSPTQPCTHFCRLNGLKMTARYLDYSVLSLIFRFLLASSRSLKTLVLDVGSVLIDNSDAEAKPEYLKALGVYSQPATGVLEEVEITCSYFTIEVVLEFVKLLLEKEACLQRLLLSDGYCPRRHWGTSEREHFSSMLKRMLLQVMSFPKRSRSLSVAVL